MDVNIFQYLCKKYGMIKLGEICNKYKHAETKFKMLKCIFISCLCLSIV